MIVDCTTCHYYKYEGGDVFMCTYHRISDDFYLADTAACEYYKEKEPLDRILGL